MCPPGNTYNDTQEKSLGLFKFLREFAELRTKTTRSLDSYEDVIWLSDIPRVKGCHAAVWFRDRKAGVEDSQLDDWVEIKKPRLPRFPEPGESIASWLDLAELHDSATENPRIREWIFVEREEHVEESADSAPAVENESQDFMPQVSGDIPSNTERVMLEDVLDVWAEIEQYLEGKWRPWAERDKELRPVQNVYSHLFHLQKSQQRLGEQYEVVLGLGLLKWRLPSGHEVKRHVIAAQTAIELEPSSGTIKVGPAGEGAKLVLEQDMLEPAERPDAPVQRQLTSELSDLVDIFWDTEKIDSILKTWINDIESEGLYSEGLEERPLDLERPTITYAPAILFRKRTERSYIRAFEEIIERIESREEIPEGLQRFVSVVSDPYQEGQDHGPVSNGSNRSAPDPEVYFPLEANSQQKNIIEVLDRSQGLLVQGPPGTGKSHTIVNLVSHLLAAGNRVLVTSHTARALSVLRRFFEERLSELAPLAVVVLGDDRKSLKAMEESVLGISDKSHSWDEEKNQTEIKALEEKLAHCRITRQKVDEEIRAIREQETYEHPPKLGGYQGTLQNIAKRVKSEKERFTFFTDVPSEDEELPFSEEELRELLSLLRDPSVQEVGDVAWCVVDPSDLQPIEKIQAVFKKELELHSAYSSFETARAHPDYPLFGMCSEEVLAPIQEDFKSLISIVDNVEKHVETWTEPMLREILADQDRPWWEFLTATREDLDAIEALPGWDTEYSVSGTSEKDLQTIHVDATALLEHLKSGGKWGVGPFRSDVVKRCIYLKKEARIDGHACDSVESLKSLASWAQVQILLGRLETRWASYAAVGSFEPRLAIARYRDLCEPIEAGREAFDLVRALQSATGNIANFVTPVWHNIPDLRALFELFKALDVEKKLFELRSDLDAFADGWSGKKITNDLDPALSKVIEGIRNRDVATYEQGFIAVREHFKHGGKAQRRDVLMSSMEACVPELASSLKESSSSEIWDEQVKLYPSAWVWAGAKNWIERLSDPEQDQILRARTTALGDDIRGCLASLSAKKAWNHCLQSLTENERQHLIAWAQSMKRLGRGKGKQAARHRKNAREHMAECRTAIPAWIMPMYRVAETMRPGVDMFDVAIIDEASQSGPEALLLTYLAKKLVVVGDSKQIVPEFVGIRRDDVEGLRKLHLSDIPHSDALGADGSFFDLAEIRYQGRVVLREHFRCMPEIIQFSNNLCYRAQPLIPLRQYSGNRLKPVVEAVHVAGGYREGRTSSTAVNKPEAEEIISRIESMVDDPRYEGKTIGVITLLGNTQSKLIESLLLERIGPETLEEYAIVCGDSYAFQGDERDVILVSMVAAVGENTRLSALSGSADERRFNVAASRARDQLILFHSVTLNDLNSHCLRAKFVEYCMNPAVDPLQTGEYSIPELKGLLETVRRREEKPPEPFDSWFEVEVFVRISERGYRVVPQVEVNGYSIDLVVDGMQDRLAVECDGDHWHGPERYQSDAVRQRTLERCGWQFWRVRGSTFHLDPDAALESLWKELARLGIYTSVEEEEVALKASWYEKEAPSEEDPDVEEHQSSSPQEEEPSLDQGSTYERKQSEGLDVSDPAPSEGSDSDKFLTGSRDREGDRSSESDEVSVEGQGSLPDPRSTEKEVVAGHLLQIIDEHGPVIVSNACKIYVSRAGYRRMGKDLSSALNKAMMSLVRGGEVNKLQELGSEYFKDAVVHRVGTPSIVVRRRGGRDFGDIPVTEIAAVIERLKNEDSALADEHLYRSVLNFYGYRRLTPKATDRIQLAEQSIDS
jgi:very-short-patch-repair endonuclease